MNKIYSFDQLTDSVELLEKKPPRFIAGLLCFLLVGLLGFMIWAYFGKLDIVSNGIASIQTNSNISVSRTQISGIVENVNVKSGDEVKKGDTLIQLKNQELTVKQNQTSQILQHLEGQKEMLEQLKQSIQSQKLSFSDTVDKKIREEYDAYVQGYRVLQAEKENEIKMIANDKISSEEDIDLQELIAEKEANQRELEAIQKQKKQTNAISEEQQQSIDDKIDSIKSQQNSIEKRIQQRKDNLENERRKSNTTKESKQQELEEALKQYKENTVISVNQRVQSLEQEIFEKKQELNGLQYQSEMTIIKAQKDGIVQFPSILQQGDLVDPGQELISIIPKENKKKVKILLPVQEINGIKKGDQVHYSFKLKNSDKQVGKVTYISAAPILDKESKDYVYELEATIDIKDFKELHTGLIGKASVVTGKEPVWKFILRKLDLI
ncbi:HlyD family efflux transporter periplasmic adaptor subunit [Bacillus sp. TD10]|uniref:HlyD family efflux transporter periplasmic adaptor subunit n=1 Tax=Bacillus sp. TD10 TaxID=1672662 RepID=UPI00391D0AE8